jgi:mannitol-1-phosphate 5-dehydrogenase
MSTDTGYTLGIDVGTTATKVILLKPTGEWEMESWPSEEGVWENLRTWLDRPDEIVDSEGLGRGISRVGITGHGPSAAIIRDGKLVGRIIPWHETLPEGCEREAEGDHVLAPNRAWVPSRLAQWESENGAIGDGVAVQLKDVLNWQLTGVVARDSRSMRGYSGNGNFHLPGEVIGEVSEAGSSLSGIPVGAEVICGCDDLSAGVFGLGAGSGDIFNLANTSEHVGQVGGEPISEMSWLPAIGRLPALTYLSTSTGGASLAESLGEEATVAAAQRFIALLSKPTSEGHDSAWQALDSLNDSVSKILTLLPRGDGEMLIGGGLAMIPQLVESRGADKRAGQEVSVLGIAKLAQKPLAVIFGAGKVGRGFLAQLLVRAGWRIHFVDPNPDLVREMAGGSYSIINLANGKVEEISGYSVSSDKWRVDEADLILTSLGASHLDSWADGLASVLTGCGEDGQPSSIARSIDIILAENHPAPAALVRSHITSERVGIAQAQVLRSCIEPTPEQVAEFGPLTVQVQDHWSLPLDGAALVRPDLVASVQGFDLRPDFATELTRKLYTYNAINAVVSYIGHQRGYEMLAEAANDVEIAAIASAAGAEASAALVKAYGFTAGEQAEWVKRALTKYQDHRIADPLERQCRDPVRKLGKDDRLFGPISLCIEHGLLYESLLLGVKAALAYQPNDADAVGGGDPSSAELRGWMESGGVREVLSNLGVKLPPSAIEILQG